MLDSKIRTPLPEVLIHLGQECSTYINMYTVLSNRYDQKLVHNLPRDHHIVLDRFLQSWRYFNDIDAQLRRLFHFDDSVWDAASDALKVAVGDSDSDVLKIGVHVRRGDIVEQDSLRQRGYVAADMSYIERAMDYMDRHLHVDSNTG